MGSLAGTLWFDDEIEGQRVNFNKLLPALKNLSLYDKGFVRMWQSECDWVPKTSFEMARCKYSTGVEIYKAHPCTYSLHLSLNLNW